MTVFLSTQSFPYLPNLENIKSGFDLQVFDQIKNITKHHDESFYVCNVNDVVEKHKVWKKNLPGIQTFYAVKCNDDLTVLEILAALGCGFDCASKNEISKVLSLGVSPDRIIYANPTKPLSQIQYASSVGVDTMTFDNVNELYKIHKAFPQARLVLRIRSDATLSQYPMGMKFGCDFLKEAPKLLRVAKSLNLEVIGVSFHVGSGCKEATAFSRAIAAARAVFDDSASLGYKFSLLDIGGGFPGAKGTSIKEMAKNIKDALSQYFNDLDVKVIAEPGTFYVASAYTIACSIHSIRNITNDQNQEVRRMYYIDNGIFGSFNGVMSYHDVVTPLTLEEYPGCKLLPSSVWGPTCDGLDKVVDDVVLPDMQIGDWIVFEDMGAYSLTLVTSFNGIPTPKVYYLMSKELWSAVRDIISVSDKNIRIIENGVK